MLFLYASQDTADFKKLHILCCRGINNFSLSLFLSLNNMAQLWWDIMYQLWFSGFIKCGHFILGMKPELLAVLKLNSPFSVKVGPVLLPLSWNLLSCDLASLSQNTPDYWLPAVWEWDILLWGHIVAAAAAVAAATAAAHGSVFLYTRQWITNCFSKLFCRDVTLLLLLL